MTRLCILGTFLALMVDNVKSFSVSSSFVGGYNTKVLNDAIPSSFSINNKNGIVMYGDSPNKPELNAWSVIASTERWISDTLKSSNQLASSSSSPTSGSMSVGGNNPYARKEVSYYCETSKESSMIVAGIFRMLREARERGEQHGSDEEERAQAVGEAQYSPKTMRQTQVIVIPGNEDFSSSFPIFDQLINAVNSARRDARDYITDAMLEKIDNSLDMDYDEIEKEWSVAINCAHLHPKFGEKSPEQQLQEMKEEEAAGEVDVNLEQYKIARQLARRSPYPTVVLEVRATPPPDFSQAPPLKPRNKYIGDGDVQEEDKISAADIQRLEALFGRSAVSDKSSTSSDEDFWNAIGNAIQEVAAVTPIKMAQLFITNLQDSSIVEEHTAFTETSTMFVDAAYEFVFTNIAMMSQDNIDDCRYYLVMPHFLSAAATSFEKFAIQVSNIIKCLPDLADKVVVETYHPEHITESRRSPVPIFAMKWRK